MCGASWNPVRDPVRQGVKVAVVGPHAVSQEGLLEPRTTL